METSKLMKIIIEALKEKLAEDIVTIDVQEKTPLYDYHVVCSASNPRKMNAIKEEVEKQIELAGGRIHHIEGRDGSPWILIDAYDIIVHIFSNEERERIRFEDIFLTRRAD